MALPFSARLARYDAAVATSARAFLAPLPVDRASPFFAAGAQTARAAEARGFRLAATPAPDSARLIETLRQSLPPGAAVLYLAGRDRKPTLEAALSGVFAFETVEAYAAEARQGWRPAEIRALDACAFAMHYSRRTALIAAALAEAGGAGERFRALTHICLSEDVAAQLRAAGAADVRVAARPDEAAILERLVEAAPLFPSRRPSRI